MILAIMLIWKSAPLNRISTSYTSPSTLVTPPRAPLSVPRSELQKAQSAVLEARATLAKILSATSKAEVLIECRQDPGLSERLDWFYGAFEQIKWKSFTFTERYLVNHPYLALEVKFGDEPPRLVWFERMPSGSYRLDLDSFIGTSDLQWKNVEPRGDEDILIRGYISFATNLDGTGSGVIVITHPAITETLKVYVSDKSLLPESMFELSASGATLPVCLLVRPIPNSPNGQRVELQRFVDTQWFVPIDRR